MRHCLLFGLAVSVALSLPTLASASVMSCDGYVFSDDDGDGVRDPGEPGVAGVGVYDGETLVRTLPDGLFAFPWTGFEPESRTLLFIKPAGYALPTRPDGLPAHWRYLPAAAERGAGDGRDPLCADLPLRPQARPAGELRVLLFSDTQTRDAREVGYYERAIVDAVKAKYSAPVYVAGAAGDLGLTLGDISNDNPSLYPALNAATTSLGVPWLHAPGNHDVEPGAPDDADSLASFHATYGPDTYAWEEPEAAFIVLDDVIWQPQQSPKYIGGLSDDQFRFLARYLQDLAADRPLVIAAHMPFFDDKPGTTTFRPADRERLFALLQRFEHVLLLTGHGHVQRQFFHDAGTGWHGAAPLHEYNVGAACGSYWGGVPAADGIPNSMMADGTPKGWAELTIRPGGAYSLRWNVAEAGTPPDTAIALHAPQVLRRGAWAGFAVYANVFMASEDARVEYRIDAGEWATMQRVEQADPRLLAENQRDDEATTLRAYDRLPEAAPSTHLWRGALPTNLAAGEHRIEVRTLDPWRGELTATASYRLDEASR